MSAPALVLVAGDRPSWADQLGRAARALDRAIAWKLEQEHQAEARARQRDRQRRQRRATARRRFRLPFALEAHRTRRGNR